MQKLILLISYAILLTVLSGCYEKTPTQPNIVIIYADDLGIGDVSCYQAGTLNTPGIDRIAAEGIRFTNGYATAATCTPSRYSLLTGEYPWRNERARVLAGNSALLIDTTANTLPKLHRANGYATAVVGKWHLGLGDGNINWNVPITMGANEVGFEHSYIMAATNDRVPTVYVDNGNVVNLDVNDPIEVSYYKNFEGEPTGRENPELLKIHPSHGHDNSITNGISRIGYMKGGKSALWVDEDMADNFLDKAKQFVSQNKNNPFFLFYALHQPHVPRVPNQRFAGSSGMGPRGDAILEADWCVNEFLKTLDELGLSENTLVIFSSDNGPVLDDGYQDQSDVLIGEHTPWGNFRGGKYSLYDAGTHVPFMARWKGQIKPGVSDALISQVDLYASIAALLNSENTRPDSQNLLDALTGKTTTGRSQHITEGLQGRIAYREGDWILIPSYKGGKKISWGVDIETGFSSEPQLYNVKEDPGQQNDLAAEMPEKVQQMQKEFNAIKSNPQ
ncbi:arylsulfatase [Carboxylicivirga sp. A043]|uniref:sulfatase family protein n=1 Tax=Carboxylicivirga litoralis TaxID=2816963 RepID=UPI0021CB32ED|nr:arylsulfatase [Carboxylicivirga sp. A043]MCU4154665.1 arylsulfatase [Carboxylicivirga sp. A043]